MKDLLFLYYILCTFFFLASTFLILDVFSYSFFKMSIIVRKFNFFIFVSLTRWFLCFCRDFFYYKPFLFEAKKDDIRSTEKDTDQDKDTDNQD
mgnify:CR=1 FL=1